MSVVVLPRGIKVSFGKPYANPGRITRGAMCGELIEPFQTTDFSIGVSINLSMGYKKPKNIGNSSINQGLWITQRVDVGGLDNFLFIV